MLEGHRLAARVSGDSAVAFSWAYCQALEGMAGVSVPPRAAWLRALALELERIANHLGDLGALGNDAGFAFGLSQFLRLKERLLRATERALGQRYLLDFVVPGGTRSDLHADGAAPLAQVARRWRARCARCGEIYEEHAGVRDRFVGAGTVTPELAARLGLIGLAGRASGQALRPARRPALRALRGSSPSKCVAVMATCWRGSRCASTRCSSPAAGRDASSAACPPDEHAVRRRPTCAGSSASG